MTWTRFSDTHSGGDVKLRWPVVYIAAPEGEARKLFAEAFSYDPSYVTCDCCGPDFTVLEEDDLDEAIAWDIEHLHDVNTRDDILVVVSPSPR